MRSSAIAAIAAIAVITTRNARIIFQEDMFASALKNQAILLETNIIISTCIAISPKLRLGQNRKIDAPVEVWSVDGQLPHETLTNYL